MELRFRPDGQQLKFAGGRYRQRAANCGRLAAPAATPAATGHGIAALNRRSRRDRRGTLGCSRDASRLLSRSGRGRASARLASSRGASTGRASASRAASAALATTRQRLVLGGHQHGHGEHNDREPKFTTHQGNLLNKDTKHRFHDRSARREMPSPVVAQRCPCGRARFGESRRRATLARRTRRLSLPCDQKNVATCATRQDSGEQVSEITASAALSVGRLTSPLDA